MTYAASRPRKAAAEEARPPEFSDDALALRFADQHGPDLRYTAAWGRWHRWGGKRWKADDTLVVFDQAREVCRSAAAGCEGKRLRKGIASAVTVSAVERLARADRRHAAAVEQWDADPWLLNTPAGIVDLRTGVLRAAKREDYCTKITGAAPAGDALLWSSFLARITNGDAELAGFLQRVAGYSLTGVTVEHGMFFLWGTGANGKTVFLTTISGVLGDYARVAPMEIFMSTVGERHPTELAGLAGSRLVTATETEDGRRWAESKVKAITGGDPIAARFMRQDFFEYKPQFKLLVAGNHKPGLRTVDEAIRRRLHLVPFTVTIPPTERDPELVDKLKAEWPGILAWAIAGCLEWQREGLKPPRAVRSATDDYFSAEDACGKWLEDCCVLGRQYSASTATLFSSWSSWCETAGERAGAQKRFAQALEARGFARARLGRRQARGFIGVGLNEEDGQDEGSTRQGAGEAAEGDAARHEELLL